MLNKVQNRFLKTQYEKKNVNYFINNFTLIACWNDILAMLIKILLKSNSSVFKCSYCCCHSVTKSCPTLCDPWTAPRQASLFFSLSWSLLKLKSIESVMSSNRLILCCPFLLLSSTFPSVNVAIRKFKTMYVAYLWLWWQQRFVPMDIKIQKRKKRWIIENFSSSKDTSTVWEGKL